MTRRTRDWEIGLSADLQDPAFARDFIGAAIEDDVPLQFVLGKVIRAYGVKEYAAKIGMASSNLLRSVGPKHNATIETLNKILQPLGLRLTVTPIAAVKRRKSA